MKVKTSKRKTHNKKGVESKDAVYADVSISQLGYIDSLLETSLFSYQKRDEIYQKAVSCTEGEAEEIITNLLDNQKDLIACGLNYGQGDIQRKLSKLRGTNTS